MVFIAEKNSKKMIVIKSLQHPARIFQREYAVRIGKAIKDAVDLINLNQQIVIHQIK